MITIWPDKHRRGWEGEIPSLVERFPVVALADGLGAPTDTDAHFVPYVLVNDADEVLEAIPRVNKTALLSASGDVPGDLRVVFGAVVLDVDDPGKVEGLVRPEWWGEEQTKLSSSGAAWYRTRGGYRMIWTLPRLFGPVEYEGLHIQLRKHARTRWGIVADENAGDWTRCYRLPFVVRDGEHQNWPAHLDDITELDIGGLASAKSAPRLFEGLSSAGKFELPEEIEGGERHATLFRYAGWLWRQGKSQEEITAALYQANDDHCVPPMTEMHEIDRMVRSVSRYSRPVEPPRVVPPSGDGGGKSRDPNNPKFQLGSEVEISEHAEVDIGGNILYDRGRFWRYAPRGVWESLHVGEIRTEIAKYDGEFVFSGRDKDGNVKTKPLKLSHNIIKGATGVLQDRMARDGYFDDAPAGVSFRNGFARVCGAGVVVEASSPEHRSTFALPHDYLPGAQPPMFLEFLRTCFRDDDDADQKIALLQEWTGAALCGLGTTYAQALALAGASGANGKSTFLSILSATFPADSRTAIPPQSMGKEYERARLARSRLNVVSELPEQDVLDSESVKAILSGDVISGREIYRAPFDFRPRAAHLFAANLLPGVRDLTPAFWRRWIVVPFTRRFSAKERILGLDRRIIETEIGQIASWALDGTVRLTLRGHFEIPASCVRAKDRWQEQSNPVAAWLSLCQIAESTKDYTRAQVVFRNFSRYAEASKSGTRLSSQKFGRRLGALGVPKDRRREGVYWGLVVPQGTF